MTEIDEMQAKLIRLVLSGLRRAGVDDEQMATDLVVEFRAMAEFYGANKVLLKERPEGGSKERKR